MRRPPRTNDRDGVLIALSQFAPNIKHDGRGMDLAELARIERRFRGDDLRAKFADALQLRGKIDECLPINDLVGNVVADPLDRAQCIATRDENPLGRFENLQEPAQTHRPHGRKHVQRDAGFGGGHRFRSSRT
jgi:hypothetical protein